MCGSACVSSSQLFDVFQASFIVSRGPLGVFDLFPNCLEMSSLKDKINMVSGVVLKTGIVGWREM